MVGGRRERGKKKHQGSIGGGEGVTQGRRREAGKEAVRGVSYNFHTRPGSDAPAYLLSPTITLLFCSQGNIRPAPRHNFTPIFLVD